MKPETRGMVALRFAAAKALFWCIGAILLVAMPIIVAWCVIGGRLR